MDVSSGDASLVFWAFVNAVNTMPIDAVKQTSAFAEMTTLCDCSPVLITTSALLGTSDPPSSYFEFDNVHELFTGALSVLHAFGSAAGQRAAQLQACITTIQHEMMLNELQGLGL